MILRELQQYLKSREQVSLKDIATHFDVEQEAVAGMLDFWVRKGKVRRISNNSACSGGCSCTHKDNSDIYQWNAQFGGVSIDSHSSSGR